MQKERTIKENGKSGRQGKRGKVEKVELKWIA
jgi:hypothetical protein